MRIDIKISGLKELQAGLQEFSDRRFRAAIATGLTRTAVEGKAAAEKRMHADLDRPTPFTLRSLYVVTATAEQGRAGVSNLSAPGDPFSGRVVRSAYLAAEVGIKDDAGTTHNGTPATKYLLPQVEGGRRHTKRFEKALQAKGALPAGWLAVPAAGARLDAFGNVSRGQVQQILAQIGTELLAGSLRTPASDKAKLAGQRRAGGQFFAVLPGRRGNLKPGIYHRELTGSNITPVFIYVRGATYRRRYGFDQAVQQVVDANLRTNIETALSQSLARLRARG
jgi:hypothetical protein